MFEEYFNEIATWEDNILKGKIPRIYKVRKDFKDPRKEKKRDYRHSNRGYEYHYNHECKYIRKMTNRILRRKLQRNLNAEYYYRITGHDYKTSGWLTW